MTLRAVLDRAQTMAVSDCTKLAACMEEGLEEIVGVCGPKVGAP